MTFCHSHMIRAVISYRFCSSCHLHNRVADQFQRITFLVWPRIHYEFVKIQTSSVLFQGSLQTPNIHFFPALQMRPFAEIFHPQQSRYTVVIWTPVKQRRRRKISTFLEQKLQLPDFTTPPPTCQTKKSGSEIYSK